MKMTKEEFMAQYYKDQEKKKKDKIKAEKEINDYVIKTIKRTNSNAKHHINRSWQ